MADAVSAISDTVSSSKIRDDYLKLLATQMSNQNPLEPMDNHDMTLQMASLAQLEQTENISSTFQKLLRSYDLVEGSKLIGKKITFFPTTIGGGKATESETGFATDVTVKDGVVKVRVNGQDVALADIVMISGADEYMSIVDALRQKISDPEQRLAIETLLAETPAEKQEGLLTALIENIDYLPTDATIQEFYNWLEAIPEAMTATDPVPEEDTNSTDDTDDGSTAQATI